VRPLVKLSVVVPFHNAERYVPPAMENLTRHATPGTEFVLVDDCSTDGTVAALERHSLGVPGARIVRRDVNGGLSAARNTGIEAAEGRYLTFLDADDWYGPGYLARLVEAIEYYACDLVRVDHVQVRGRERVIVRSPEGRRHEVFDTTESIAHGAHQTGVDYPYAWAGIFDLERMGKDRLRFDAGLHTAEDRPWIWRLYLNGAAHAVVGLTGLFYRREVVGSLTQIGDDRQLHFIDAFDLVVGEVRKEPEWERRFLPKALRSYCAITAHHLQTDQRYRPELRGELRRRSADALRRLPPEPLDRALREMGGRRALLLRWVMRRYH
jgi:glycosyltransferase involved in cell wall biosynthesis